MPYEPKRKVIPMSKQEIDAVFKRMDRLSKGLVPSTLSFNELIKELNND